MTPFSIRARLTLWHAGALALIIVVFATSVFCLVRAWLFRDLDRAIGRDLLAIEKVYRTEPTELNELESEISIDYFQVRQRGRILFQSYGWTREGLSQALADAPAQPRSWTSPNGSAYRIGEVELPGTRIALALSEKPVAQSLAALAAILALGVPIALAIAVFGGYVIAGRILAPIDAMAAHAQRISAESLNERLPAGNSADELGRLAAVLNHALTRVQQSFGQLRRFTADASHELRTPLTAMRSVGEVAMQRPLDANGYREVIGSMLEEAERLTRLVESLLTLTRADSGVIRTAREPVNLSAIAASVARSRRTVMLISPAAGVYLMAL